MKSGKAASVTYLIKRLKLLSQTTLILILSLTFSHSFATEITPLSIKPQIKSVKTAHYLFYYEDKTNQLLQEEVIQLPKDKWSVITSNSANFGTAAATFWFQLKLLNSASDDLSLVALDNYPATDSVELFVFNSNDQQIAHYLTGDRHPNASLPIDHLSFAFPVTLLKQEELTLLFKINSGGNLIVPISIWSELSFFNYQKDFFLIFGLLTGILVITCIYNLFIYIRTQERLFLSFSFFIFSVASLVLHQSGIAKLYLWNTAVNLNEFGILLSISFAVSGHIAFSLNYLTVGKKFRIFFLTILGLCLLVLPGFLIFPYGVLVKFSLMCGIITLITIISYSITFSFMNDITAKAYTFAWTPFVMGTLTSALIRFDLIPYNIYTDFAGLFFAVITVVWLSMAIADRINTEKSHRISAQHSAISNLKRYEELFEHSVEGIFSSTVEGKLLKANPAMVSILKYPDENALFNAIGNDLKSVYKHQDQREELINELIKKRVIIDKEIELIRANKEPFWASLSIRISRLNQNSITVFEGAMIDISVRKESENKLAYLAAHDPLTNLFNRREFEVQLRNALADHHQSNVLVSVLYMDLDQFKVVNDTCGHTVGDKLLRQLTQLMATTLDGRGLFARLGGDEFGLILRDFDRNAAYDLAEEIRRMIEDYRFSHKTRMFSLGISIGLVELAEGFESIEDVMSFADTACYTAKDAGRNQIHVYSSKNIEFEKRRQEMELVTSINTAIAKNCFQLYQQKIVFNDNKNTLHGYEILVRMFQPNGDICLPGEFITAAERYGLMPQIDQWVIEHTFDWLQRNPNDLEAMECCSINLSGQSLGYNSLTEHLLHCFSKYQIPHAKICFEITETCAIQDIVHTVKFIELFQGFGCYFSLDDFGSGLSSYGYLKTLPVNYLKIDGRFVKNIAQDPVDYAMVESIHTVARAMGKKTIAEFVENDAIIEKLKAIGVDYLQGYAIDKPQPIPHLTHSFTSDD